MKNMGVIFPYSTHDQKAQVIGYVNDPKKQQKVNEFVFEWPPGKDGEHQHKKVEVVSGAFQDYPHGKTTVSHDGIAQVIYW